MKHDFKMKEFSHARLYLAVLLSLTVLPVAVAQKYTIGIAPVTFDTSLYRELEATESATSAVAQPTDAPAQEEAPLMAREVMAAEAPAKESAAAAVAQAEASPTSLEADQSVVELTDFSRLPKTIRDAEALVIKKVLQTLLERQGGDRIVQVLVIPAVSVVKPSIQDAVHAWVELHVTRSDLLELHFEVSARTVLGEDLFQTKKYTHKFTHADFRTSSGVAKVAYEAPLAKAAADIIDSLSKVKNCPAESVDTYFACKVAPAHFAESHYFQGSRPLRPRKSTVPNADDPHFIAAQEARLGLKALYRRYDEKVITSTFKGVLRSYDIWQQGAFEVAQLMEQVQNEFEKGKQFLAIVALLPRFVDRETAVKIRLMRDSLMPDIETIDKSTILARLMHLISMFQFEDGKLVYDRASLEHRVFEFGLGASIASSLEAIEQRKSGLQTVAELNAKLDQVFEKTAGSTTLEYDGRSFQLTGSKEDKMNRLQTIIAENYAEEISGFGG